MLAIGTSLPPPLLAASVLDPQGRARRLGDVLDGRPSLLVFLRHFGCSGCAQQVHALLPFAEQILEQGVAIVLLGNGPPPFLEEFSKRFRLGDYGVVALTDPTRKAFELVQLPRSFWKTYGPSALAKALSAWVRGFATRRARGDRLQQGGVVVSGSDMEVLFAASPHEASDVVSMSLVVAAAARAGGAAEGVA